MSETGAPIAASTRPHSLPDLPDTMLADNLRRLVVRHKRDCDDECDINLILALPVFERLIGRKATTEELADFI